MFQTFTDVFKGYVSSLLDYASDVMGIDGVKDLELVLPQVLFLFLFSFCIYLFISYFWKKDGEGHSKQKIE